jgi:hypothetical protein
MFISTDLGFHKDLALSSYQLQLVLSSQAVSENDPSPLLSQTMTIENTTLGTSNRRHSRFDFGPRVEFYAPPPGEVNNVQFMNATG